VWYDAKDEFSETFEGSRMEIRVLRYFLTVVRFDFIRLVGKERWVVLMRPDDPLAEKEAVSAKDLENMPLILPRRTNVRNELSNWLGDSFQSARVLFTSNLSTNGALIVQRGLAYSIAIEGAVPFWDKEKLPVYGDWEFLLGAGR